MSSRDIEGENPLYLPQAKVYDRSCALGPCILVASEPLPKETPIGVEIERHGSRVFSGSTNLAELKRPIPELAEYLFRENSFPHGVFLMTGTGIVPPDEFSLAAGDRIRITIDPIGTLENDVVQSGPLPANARRMRKADRGGRWTAERLSCGKPRVCPAGAGASRGCSASAFWSITSTASISRYRTMR